MVLSKGTDRCYCRNFFVGVYSFLLLHFGDCNLQGREAIATKASKAGALEKPLQVVEGAPLKKSKGVMEPAPTSATLAPPIVAAPPMPLKQSTSNEVSSSSSAAHRQRRSPVIGQPIPPGAANTFSSSDEENEDGSDEECEDINSDPHLLRLVMKEQHQIKQERKGSQGQAVAAAPTTSKRKLRGDAVPVLLPPPETGYFPHQHKPDPVSAMVPKHVLDKELVRVHHTNFASNITMSISDTMLKPDFSALSGQNGRNIDMSTTQQATRQVLSNTKFFKMLHEGRKKQLKREEQSLVHEETAESTTEPVQKTEKLKTKRRVLEVLCDSDSDQEKEDSKMLMFLGE